MKDLNQCREEIDAIDKEMIALFEKRMNVAKDVITYKLANHMDIFQAAREAQVVEKNVNRIHNEELKEYAKSFILDMMNISKTYQASFIPTDHVFDLSSPQHDHIIVGYPGVPGSFSETALTSYFGSSANRKNYKNFEDVFKALENNEIDYGVVPLENSSTGAINDNYDSIRDYGFYIVGEQNISVSQHLLGIKGACIEGIKEVYSHPQGLLQSSQFLSQHPKMKQREYVNTATAAKYIAESQNPQIAAIASDKAAQLYDLEILQENIQDIQNNSTRFIIFGKHLEKSTDATHVSIVFTLSHQVGTLYQVMKIINDHQINMLRIESRPIKAKPWEYYFYVDFEGNLENQNIIQALEDMKAHTITLRVLGQYVKK
ncbi:prephenate dehydratase [Candidatus Stoquefichus massiliensis]|uniref:prephenate dehydratase n=1 Tax=Candidatus Stoquefichus massiliensis TaxID=1470350 RepID=UPI000483965B|nr:prephenate dehydratase [Candidatus Stoquefichus massiliensis]